MTLSTTPTNNSSVSSTQPINTINTLTDISDKVLILYTQVPTIFENEKYEAYYQSLPTFISNRVNKYRNSRDKMLGILGKHLLIDCLKRFGLPARLDSLDYDESGRPFLKEFPQLDFNISHSGDIVTCAASISVKLGIDIEQKDAVEIDNFKGQLSNNEWQTLQDTTDSNNLFFQYWVKKEAITKTDGSGLSIDFSKVDVSSDRIYYNNDYWLFTALPIHPNYKACIATNEVPSIQSEEVFF